MEGTMGKSSRRARTYKTRAEKFMYLDTLHKRVNAIRTKTGLKHDKKAYLSFDLAFYKMDVDDRRKLLKEIFSEDGREIKIEHEPHIELLETFIQKIISF
jgi:3-hydroxy-3-methylglutaryl CoA synthase